MAQVLAIDDNPSVRKVVEFCLKREGHSILTAADGPTGLRLAAENPVDFIFLDYEMPVMKGTAVCRTLKGDPALKAIPVVMITAYSTNDVVTQALAAGALEVLTKPFSIERLKSSLKRHLPALQPAAQPAAGA